MNPRWACAALWLLGCEPAPAENPPPPQPPPPTLPPAATPTPTQTAPPPAPTPAPLEKKAPFVVTSFPASPPQLDISSSCPKGKCPIAVKFAGPAGAEQPPARLFEASIGAGARVEFPRDDAFTVIAVVMTGKVTDQPSEPVQESHNGEIRKEHAVLEGVLYKGAGFSLLADAPSRVFVAIVSQRGQPVVAQGKAWTKRPGRSSIRRFDLHSPPLAWGGGAFNAAMGLDDQGPGSDGGAGAELEASIELLGITAGGAVGTHDHANEWELLAIMAGEGDMEMAGVKRHVSPGNLISIPKAVPHSFQASPASGPLVAIQLYTPPGPEQRFRKAASQSP